MSKRLRILNRSSQRKQRGRELSTLCHLRAQGNCLCPALDGAVLVTVRGFFSHGSNMDETPILRRRSCGFVFRPCSIRVSSVAKSFWFWQDRFRIGEGCRRDIATLQRRDNKSFGPNGASQDGQTCKSDVKVLLHAHTQKMRFYPREMQFFAQGNVKVRLQRKKLSRVQRSVQEILQEKAARSMGVSRLVSKFTCQRWAVFTRPAHLQKPSKEYATRM